MKSKYVEREESVEDYLCRRVKELGGETRKVVWVGRRNAPDQFVGLPPEVMKGEVELGLFMTGRYETVGVQSDGGYFRRKARHFYVEVKKPGLAAKFPRENDDHEQAQFREHQRMRAWGCEVHVIDSKEDVERILA